MANNIKQVSNVNGSKANLGDIEKAAIRGVEQGANTFAGVNTFNGNITTTDESATYGAGALSTEIAPSTKIYNFMGDIITTIQVDLTGLKSANDDGDIIGLDGTDGAYLLQYKTATHGILYKSEVICVELPTASSNECLDFDIAAVAAADGAYDDDANAGTFHTGGGNVALGTSQVDLAMGTLTNNHYVYLLTGATHSGASVFTGGKLVIKLYGRASF